MSRKKIKSTVSYGILTAGVLSLVGFAVAYVYMPNAVSAASVRTASVVRGNVETEQTATGNIDSASAATVGFPISGTLTQVNVSLGSKVTAGEVIAKINPSSAQATLSAAEASLSAAEQNLATAQQGGSTANKLSNQLTVSNDESAITTDEQQLTTDKEDLSTAKLQLRTDENLACPAAGSSTVTSAISGGSTNSAPSAAAGGGTSQSSAGGTTSSGSSSAGGKFTSSFRNGSAYAGDSPAVVAKSPRFLISSPKLVKHLSEKAVTAGSVSVTQPPTPAQSTTTTATTTTTTLAPVAPVAVTGTSTGIATDEVNLSGSVTPGNTSTSYYFAWGETDQLSEHTPTVTLSQTSGTVQVSAPLTGLKADTNYLFRLVAQNAVGQSEGYVQLFTTAASSCTEEKTVISEDETAMGKQKTTIQDAKNTLAAAEASITQSEQNNNVTVATDRAAVTEDQATVAADEKNLQETTLIAPISGTITSLNDLVGETVSAYSGSGAASGASATPTSGSGSSAVGSGKASSSSSAGSGFATITDLNDFQIVAGFAEADISSIKIGQTASITFPALPNVTASGKVTYVSDIPAASSSVVTYNVTITVTGTPSSVKDGMTADVAIITGSASGVLTVPSAAVTTSGTSSTVTVDKHGTDRVVSVKVGLVGSSTTQILSGVQSGETVVLPVVKASSGAGAPAVTGGFGGGLGRLARLGGKGRLGG